MCRQFRSFQYKNLNESRTVTVLGLEISLRMIDADKSNFLIFQFRFQGVAGNVNFE